MNKPAKVWFVEPGWVMVVNIFLLIGKMKDILRDWEGIYGQFGWDGKVQWMSWENKKANARGKLLI